MNNSESPNRRVAKQTSFTSFQSPSTTSQSLSDYFTKSTYGSARIGDPKTQLLHRWQGLAQQMSQTQMAWDVVIALNRNLDQVEDMLSHKAPLDNYQNLRGWDRGLGILHMEDSGVDVGYESETTPPASNAPKELELSHVGNTDDPMCSTALLERVTHAIKQLRDRQKEFRHLHDVAAARAEEESKTIARLKSQINQLEHDVTDDETELTYLKLQLRIIEIQTMPYVPKSDHDDLALGIQRWKLDWADVDKRYRKRRWKRELDKNPGLGSSSSLEKK